MIRLTTDQNVDTVDITMQTASALPEGKRATSADGRIAFSQSADQPTQVLNGTCALTTMKVGMESSQSKVTLLLDIGADYQRSTAGEDLTQLKRCSHKFIKTHADERYKILGSTELATRRHGIRDVLQLNITEDDLAPLLSYGTSIRLGLVTINDCDSPANSSGLNDNPSVRVTF